MHVKIRIKALGVVGAAALLGGGLGSIPASAGHNPDDVHSDNAKKLIRRPIEIVSEREAVTQKHARGSDLAFQRRLMVAGTYEGTALFRTQRKSPELKQVGFHDCPGSQGDVSIWNDIVFVSVDSPSSNNVQGETCNNTGTTGSATSESSLTKEGIRVVDISNRSNPRQVGFVETACGSHTHTLVPHGDFVYMYVQSYPLGSATPLCNNLTFDYFSILRFPKDDPSQLELVGKGPVRRPSIGCHDTTVYPKKDIAVSACLQNSLVLDIKDPANPVVESVITNAEIEFHHTSAITWDGDYAIVSDEHAGAAGGGGCEGNQDSTIGEMWFYNINNPSAPQTQPDWHYQLPRQPPVDSLEEGERYRCTTHNYNILPMRDPNRYVAVSAYYAGGWSMVDFSDPSNPKEMAHYLPVVDGNLPDMWSTYWYNGRIYANEHASRLGVSAYKKDNNGRAQVRFFEGRFNPQTQMANFQSGPEDTLSSGACKGFARGSRTDRIGGGKVIVGTTGHDVLTGTAGDDVICGLGGNDIIDGNGGQDEIVGNGGNDTITGGGNKDSIRGGNGRDAIDGTTGNDVILGGADDDALRGNGGWDTLRGARGRDTLQGGDGNDALRGGSQDDTLKGFAGADLLNGDAGTDTCDGGLGNDVERSCER